MKSRFNFQSIETAGVTIGQVLGVPTPMAISNVIGVGDTVYTGFIVPPPSVIIKLWRKDGKCYRKIGSTTEEIPDFSFLKNNGLDESDFQIRDYNAKRGSPLHKECQYNSYMNLFNDWVDDKRIYETFSYFADKSSWDSLYKVYKMVKFDVDGILGDKLNAENCKITRYHWVEEGELKEFKKAANHPHAEGRPRHSTAYYLHKKKMSQKGRPQSCCDYKEQKRSNPEPLMSLAEANNLIKRLFKRWYEVKLLELRLCYFADVAKYLNKTYKLYCFNQSGVRY